MPLILNLLAMVISTFFSIAPDPTTSTSFGTLPARLSIPHISSIFVSMYDVSSSAAASSIAPLSLESLIN